MAFAQSLLEGRVQLFGGDLALLQIDAHQVFIHFDNLVDQGAVGVLDTGKIGFAGGIEETVGHPAALARRQIDGQAFPAEGALNLGEEGGQVRLRNIDLVDHDHAAQLAGLGPVHHAMGGQFDAFLGVEDHHGGVDGIQRAHGLPHVIRVARRVENVDQAVLMRRWATASLMEWRCAFSSGS
jgi:hypothetical protein